MSNVVQVKKLLFIQKEVGLNCTSVDGDIVQQLVYL